MPQSDRLFKSGELEERGKGQEDKSEKRLSDASLPFSTLRPFPVSPAIR